MQRWFITTGILFLTCGLLFLSGAFTTFSDLSLKLLFQLRGERTTNQEIIIIGVDEETIDHLGAWPFARSTHAKLLKQLSQAKAIGFDFLFTDPTIDDELFSHALQQAPPVILAAATDYNQKITEPAITLSGYHGIGIIDTEIDKNGTVKNLSQNINAAAQPFAIALANIAGVRMPPSPADHSKLINYYGPEFTFLYLSYLDVLTGVIPPSFFNDRFVLIGAQAIGLGDVHLTPLSTQHPVPGVEIQATILNNLLDNSFIHHSNGLVYFTFSLMFFLSLIWRNLSQIQNFFITFLCTCAFCAISYFSFLKNIFIDPSFPTITLIIGYAIHLLTQEIVTAKTLISRIQYMDTQLASGIQDLYTTPPDGDEQSQLQSVSKHTVFTKGIQRHLDRLQQATQALSLQTHFIKHLLKKEAPPLAIWDSSKGSIIVTNAAFDTLWESFEPDSPLPDLQTMATFLTDKNYNRTSTCTVDVLPIFPTDSPVELDICVTPKGKRHFYHVTVQNLDPAGTGFSGYLINFTNVSEIHELERVKSEVLSIVSHELKLPLTVIQGYGEMLANSLPKDQAKFADEICNHTQRLNQMIVEFLDIERIESGKYVLRSFPFNFIEMLEEGNNSVLLAAEKKNIKLMLNTPAKTTPFIGDETLTLQAYINLLDNAIKFSPPDTVVTTDLVEQKEELILSVTDQGPGISQDKCEAIFNKFDRGEEHPEKAEGFGLGLALVKQVVNSHGGSISVTTVENPTGAQFTVRLPKTKL